MCAGAGTNAPWGRVILTGIYMGKNRAETKAVFEAAGLFAVLGQPGRDVSP